MGIMQKDKEDLMFDNERQRLRIRELEDQFNDANYHLEYLKKNDDEDKLEAQKKADDAWQEKYKVLEKDHQDLKKALENAKGDI